MISSKINTVFFILFLGIVALPVVSADNPAPIKENPGNGLTGVGALGRIEPRSRVIRVSHNAGAEGVNIQQLFVHEGDTINQGETLAILADYGKKQADLEAGKANYAAIGAKLEAEKVDLSFAEKEYNRYQTLSDKALTSRSTSDSKILALQQAQAGIKQLQAEMAVAKANEKVLEESVKNAIITAPLTGTVMKIHARPGERLNDNGLLEMADLTQLDVVAEVFEADLPKVKIGQKAEVTLFGNRTTYSAVVREFAFMVRKGDPNDTDPLADRDNRVVEVRLTLDPRGVAELQHQIYRQAQIRILM